MTTTLLCIAVQSIILAACAVTSSGQGMTNAVFRKTLQSNTLLEVYQDKLSDSVVKTHNEQFRKEHPGIMIFETKEAYRFDFCVIRGQIKTNIWAKEHFVADMGAGFPQAFVVFDAVLTNDTIYLLIKQSSDCYLQPVFVDERSNSQAKKTEKLFSNNKDPVRNAFSGQILLTTNEFPDVVVGYPAAEKAIWRRQGTNWVETPVVEKQPADGGKN